MATVLNRDNEIFVVHIATLAELITMPIYFFYQAQVELVIRDKTRIPAEYSNFFNVFSSNSAVELPEHNGINDHFIDLLNSEQLPYGQI